jgi:hypothetical protein
MQITEINNKHVVAKPKLTIEKVFDIAEHEANESTLPPFVHLHYVTKTMVIPYIEYQMMYCGLRRGFNCSFIKTYKKEDSKKEAKNFKYGGVYV